MVYDIIVYCSLLFAAFWTLELSWRCCPEFKWGFGA